MRTELRIACVSRSNFTSWESRRCVLSDMLLVLSSPSPSLKELPWIAMMEELTTSIFQYGGGKCPLKAIRYLMLPPMMLTGRLG